MATEQTSSLWYGTTTGPGLSRLSNLWTTKTSYRVTDFASGFRSTIRSVTVYYSTYLVLKRRIRVNVLLLQGEDNDNDKYHVAYSWVVVKLRDINDNKPQFERPNIEVSVYENAEVGKSLETFKATDPDQGGKSKVKYAIDRTSDRKRQFSINQEGTVSIQRNLDREETPRHQVSQQSSIFSSC